jgi:hypothetical protein
MRFVDSPIRRAFGRTPRELLVLVTGVLMVAHSIRSHDTSWNGPVTALVTVLFAARVFAARVAALALCVAALALCAAHAIDPAERAADMAPAIAQFGLGILVLASRDLRARFDDTGRGLGPVRNFWRDLPAGDRRSIARVVCAGAATASLLHHASHGAASWGAPYTPPGWLGALVVLACAGGALLVAGRALGLVIAAGFGAAALAYLVPIAQLARAARAGAAGPGDPDWLRVSGSYVDVACLCAAATLAFSLPWLVRLARRALI